MKTTILIIGVFLLTGCLANVEDTNAVSEKESAAPITGTITPPQVCRPPLPELHDCLGAKEGDSCMTRNCRPGVCNAYLNCLPNQAGPR